MKFHPEILTSTLPTLEYHLNREWQCFKCTTMHTSSSRIRPTDQDDFLGLGPTTILSISDFIPFLQSTVSFSYTGEDVNSHKY